MENGNITFTMIKPCAVKQEKEFDILSDIKNAGFKIIALKKTKLSKEQAQKFYEIHKDRPFYKELCDFMSSGPIYAACLKKENAVNDFRKLIGNTNPELAEKNTIRKKYALSIQENAVHGSDSNENASIETKFFFSNLEIFE